MKKIARFCLCMTLLLCVEFLSAQDKSISSNSQNQQKKINYYKYIDKTVAYFFSDFPLHIKDTIPIRTYVGIHSFILGLDSNIDLYINPQILRDSASRKRKIEDPFDLKFFYPYKIRSIVYKKNGKTIKIYGKYGGKL